MNNAFLKIATEEIAIKNEILDQTLAISQNFGLTKVAFDTMVDKLKLGDESLFKQIFLSHFKDCSSFLVKHYKAPYEIAYDITMDTLIEFRYKLLTDKICYDNLRFLFTKIAGQLYLKYLAKQNKVREVMGLNTNTEDDYEDKLIALKKAWSSLSPEDKKLLEQFYYLDISLIKLAELENKSDAAMRKQKQRAIAKLRQVFFNIYNNI